MAEGISYLHSGTANLLGLLRFLRKKHSHLYTSAGHNAPLISPPPSSLPETMQYQLLLRESSKAQGRTVHCSTNITTTHVSSTTRVLLTTTSYIVPFEHAYAKHDATFIAILPLRLRACIVTIDYVDAENLADRKKEVVIGGAACDIRQYQLPRVQLQCSATTYKTNVSNQYKSSTKKSGEYTCRCRQSRCLRQTTLLCQCAVVQRRVLLGPKVAKTIIKNDRLRHYG